jgi:hypothetical protein
LNGVLILTRKCAETYTNMLILATEGGAETGNWKGC